MMLWVEEWRMLICSNPELVSVCFVWQLLGHMIPPQDIGLPILAPQLRGISGCAV